MDGQRKQWWHGLGPLPLVLGLLGLAGHGGHCLFSEVAGVVLKGGEPREGTIVERSFEWRSLGGGDAEADSVLTNPEGAFHLPPVFRRLLLASLLPRQPQVYQRMTIQYDGGAYVGWRYLTLPMPKGRGSTALLGKGGPQGKGRARWARLVSGL